MRNNDLLIYKCFIYTERLQQCVPQTPLSSHIHTHTHTPAPSATHALNPHKSDSYKLHTTLVSKLFVNGICYNVLLVGRNISV